MINFVGVDILLGKAISHPEIKSAISQILSYSEHCITVIDDIEELLENPNPGVVCVLKPVSGDFVTWVQVFTAPIRLQFENNLEPLQKLVDLLECPCLASDEEINPYLWWLLTPNRPIVKVALDPTAMDEERYVIDYFLE